MSVTLNQGLKSYQESITHEIGLLKAKVNLCPIASNVVVEIPLFKTIGINSMTPTLIYNYQSRNSGGLFRGAGFNYLPTLYKNGNDIYINNPDGTTDYYNGYNNINLETNSYIHYSYSGRDLYNLVDKYNNTISFLGYNYNYPNQITFSNGNSLNFTYSGTVLSKISNNYGDEIYFTYFGYYYGEIIYKKNNTTLFKAYLGLTNSKLSSVDIKKIENGIETRIAYYTILEGTNTLVVKDEILDYSYTYTFNNDNQVISFYDSYYPNKITTLSYSDTTTTLTNIYNKITKYYFSNGLLTFIINSLDEIIENSYDLKTKKIKEKNHYPLNIQNILLVNMSGFNLSNAFFIAPYQEIDTNYDFITNKYKITGNNGSCGYTLYETGKYNDTLQFVFFIKILSGDDTNYLYAQMSIGNQITTRKIDLQYKEGYKLVSLELTAKKDFTHIHLDFIGYGIEAVVGGLSVIKNTGLKTYTYTDSNLTNYDSKYHKQDMNYDNNLVSSNIGTNLPSTNYEYDNRCNVTKEEKPYLMDINNTYNVYNQPLTKELKGIDSTKIKEEYVYNNDHLLQTKKDSLLNETTYTYNTFGNVESETVYLKNEEEEIISTIITSYSYDSKLNLSSITKDNEITTYTYNDKNMITGVSISNGNTYTFNYNDKDNLSSVSINNVQIGSYTYDSYGRISSSSYGFSFEYTIDKLTSVSYNESTLYSIEYDSKNRIEEIKDENDNTLEAYIYDDEDKLIEKNISDFNIRYDYSDSEVGATLYTLGNNKIYQSYNSINKSFNTSKEAILHQFEKEVYVGEYRENHNLKYKNDLKLPNTSPTFTRFIDDYIPYIKPGSNLSYETSDKVMIGFWFKQDYPYSSYIFSMNQNNVFIGVYIDSSNYLHMMIENNGNTTYVNMTNQVMLGYWNYFGLEYIDNGNERKILFELNEEVRIGNVDFSLSSPYTYHIGYKYYNNTKTGVFPGGISNLMLGKDNVSEGYIYSYYTYTKNYIYQNQIEEFQNTPYISTSSFSDVSNLSYDCIPLENNFKSKNGIEPYRFDIHQDLFYDSSRTFSYNAYYKRYCYLAYGNKLVYDFNFTNNGTIFMKGSILESKDIQYFISIKNEFGSSISVYRNQNKHIILKCDYYEIDSGYSIMNGSFEIGLSYNETNHNTRDITLFVGNNTVNRTVTLYNSFTNTKIYIGSDSEGNNALMGMIMDIYYKKEYTVSIPSSISNKIEYHKNHYYDSFGRMNQYILYKNTNELFKNTYSFKTRSDDTYTSLQVKKETIKINNTNYERNYTLDSLGRVTSITDTTFGSHTYTYDNLGYLSFDDNKEITYDNNGNITNYGTNHYDYDSLSRLTSYNNNPIEYDTTHPFLMKKFNGYKYSYQGKRLVTVTKNNKTINYTYDLEGLIIQKEVVETNTITNYYYDNRKLIKEVSGNNIIEYIYDENNQLYGYKENNNVYFYIRDVLKNIIGIIDNNGLIVSKFDYDAYGNIINQTGTIISNFRYKGYYYDTDVELYYLKTRFYNPILLRFITPDSIEYLDSSSIIGLNLYAYCGNDPINMVDENGNWWENVWGLFCAVGETLTGVGIGFAVGGVSGAIIGGLTGATAGVVSYCDRTSMFGHREIKDSDVNINNRNNGDIIVVIDENSIEIVDSYLFGDEEKSQILDIIMESNEYKEYGYKRTKNSYMREWRAHNFVHAFIPFGEIGNKTKNVNLNREEEKDSHSWAYKFFW